MPIWVMVGIYEGEIFCTTHFTEKGAALAAIQEVLSFLGVECEETALAVMNGHWLCPDTKAEHTEPIEWDHEKLRGMDRDKLWGVFGEWAELTWDNDRGYQIDVNKTMVKA